MTARQLVGSMKANQCQRAPQNQPVFRYVCYFGAVQLLADIETRFRVPPRGGRATDPKWTERRLLPLARQTLTRLERLAAQIQNESDIHVDPMQLAGLLLEKSMKRVSDEETKKLVRSRTAKRSFGPRPA